MKPRTPLEAKLRLISPSRAASCHGTYCAPQGPPVLGDYSLTGIPPIAQETCLGLSELDARGFDSDGNRREYWD